MTLTCPNCETTSFLDKPFFCAACLHPLADAPPKAIHPAAVWRRVASMLVDVAVLALPSALISWRFFQAQAPLAQRAFADGPREESIRWLLSVLLVVMTQTTLTL